MENTGIEAAPQEPSRADIEAGFNESVTGQAAPTETPAPEATPTVTEEEPIATEPEPAPEPMIAGFKESEVRALLGEIDGLKKDLRNVYGQYGGMKNFVEQKLKALPTSTTGGVTRINPKAIERLKSEYGDELAEIFADFIQGGSASEPDPAPAQVPAATEPNQPQPTGIDQAEVDRRIAQATAEAKALGDKNLAIAVIDIKHPDRFEVTASPDFKVWLGTLPEAEQEKVMTTWDANELSKRLDTFKTWNAKRLTNAKRLSGAVAPKGAARPTQVNISDQEQKQRDFDSVFASP